MKWQETTLCDWLDQIREVLASCDLKKTVFSGFSVGANFVTMIAVEKTPCELWLMSMGNLFADDELHKGAQQLMGQSYDDLRQVQFPGDKITCPTLVFIGTDEMSCFQDRALRTHAGIQGSRLIEVPGAKHNTCNPVYVDSIKQHI